MWDDFADVEPLRLPPPDRELSPVTGWTRTHWETLADHLLDAVAEYATPGYAQFRMPGRTSRSGPLSDGLEGFARTFLLAAFRIAGAGGNGVDRLIERYSLGLAAGTDPASPTAWPKITDRKQPMVEAAAIAVSLHESRRWLWDRLDRRTQDAVLGWLSDFTGKQTPDNNWVLFQVVTGQFLASAGGPADLGEIERGLDRIEEWYVGDGWYSDGPGQNFDYYIGWAMHLYPLLWTRMAGAGDGGRGRVYRQRLREFLAQYQYFFAPDGAPVHQGRSLTYRFASVAPLWLGALFDATPLSPGQTRRLASGVVRHFVSRGVPDADGLLRLGWYRPFLPVTQEYSGPGSPYWASKGFAGLLLPPGHPAWTAAEEPAGNDLGDQVIAMRAPGFLLHSTGEDGVVRLLNHGSDHLAPERQDSDDPHYAKLAYSSHTAPETGPAAWRRNVDAQVTVLAADGTPARRIRIERVSVSGDRASSRYRARLEGGGECRIETAALVWGPIEIRAHLVRAPFGLRVRDGGYAVAGAQAPATGDGQVTATATGDGLTSMITGLHGWAEAGISEELEANAFGAHSAAPFLLSEPLSDPETVLVSMVVLAGSPPGVIPAVSVRGRVVTVTLPDGTAELELGS